jgi:hypothetical protein
MMKPCPECGKICENLGVHKRFCKGNATPIETHLIVDQVTSDKPLSALLNEVKELLRRYQSVVSIKVSDRGGKPYEVEIIARIQV